MENTSPIGLPSQAACLRAFIIILFNDLDACTELLKLVDDVTVTETINQSEHGAMQRAFAVKCKDGRRRTINKAMDMIIGHLANNPLPPVFIGDRIIGRVTSFKLFGVTVTNNLTWDDHVSSICMKANTRLHFTTG